VVKQYIPKKGDIVVLTFDPQAGHAQQGKRPALILSDELFNKNVGLAIACPITNTDRNFPFHVPVNSKEITGFIMSEQIKSIDFKARKVKFISKVDEEILGKVQSIVESVLF